MPVPCRCRTLTHLIDTKQAGNGMQGGKKTGKIDREQRVYPGEFKAGTVALTPKEESRL
jgi:hypothetical protein